MPSSDDLESDLRTLLLEAFADGRTVCGTWQAETVPDEVPDWEIVVERLDAENPSSPTRDADSTTDGWDSS